MTATIAAIRFGYGLPLPGGAPVTPGAMLAALAGPDVAAAAHPVPALADVLPLIRDFDAARAALRKNEALRPAYDAAVAATVAQQQAATRATLVRTLGAADGLRERLVRFWANHFTVVSTAGRTRALPFTLTEDVIRPLLSGRFAAMLRAVAVHPAMLLYLNQAQSIGPGSPVGKKRKRGLNENYARELIELHTLGVGAGYSQTDVRELAELLTGLAYDPETGFRFAPRWAEPGPETVLGRRYEGAGLKPIHAVLEDLALRPETARHIARKLAVHFVADEPPADLVADLEAAFVASDGDLSVVHAALLHHPAAWGPLGGKARQPIDFVLAGLRALGVTAADLAALAPLGRLVLNPMRAMGQRIEGPYGPDGWPEAAEAWITPQGLGARIKWALEVPKVLRPDLPDPVDFARAALGDAADPRLLWAAARAESLQDGAALVLASPAFNRR